MALRFEEFCTELESFYSNVVVPRMSYLGEQTQQTMLDISTELSNIKRRMQNFGTNMATKMMGGYYNLLHDSSRVIICFSSVPMLFPAIHYCWLLLQRAQKVCADA